MDPIVAEQPVDLVWAGQLDSQLLSLPEHVLSDILYRLGAKDLTILSCTCQAFHQLCTAEPLYVSLLRRDYGIRCFVEEDQSAGTTPDTPAVQPEGSALGTFDDPRSFVRDAPVSLPSPRQVYYALARRSFTARDLSLKAYYLHGDMDEVSPEEEDLDDDEPSARERYWIDNLFRPLAWNMFCSSSEINTNISCFAAIAWDVDGKWEEEAEYHEYLVQLLYNTRHLRRVWNLSLDGFSGIRSYSTADLENMFMSALQTFGPREMLESTPRDQRRQAHDKLVDTVGRLQNRTPTPRLELKAVPLPGRSGWLCPEALGALQQACPAPLAVAHKAVVRRPTGGSCPGQVGIVYGSMQLPHVDHLRLTDDSDSLLTLEEVLALAEKEAAYRIAKLHQLREGCIVEFARPQITDASAGYPTVYPIFWFRFQTIEEAEGEYTQEEEEGEMEALLRYPRGLRSVVVKLIAAENRMDLYGDDHPQPNLDMDYIGLRGWKIQ